MIYYYEVITPANTPESSAQVTTLALNRGVITKVNILFPTGCAGLLRARLKRFGRQIFPSSSGESFAGNGTMVEWIDNYELDEEPFVMDLETWNDDDTYQHALYISIEIMRPFRGPEGLGRAIG
jgi:hypothetical protein